MGLALSIILVTLNACSEDGLHQVKEKASDLNIHTEPYQDTIEFKLSTSEMLLGIDEPHKITSVHDTDVHLIEVYEDTNTMSGGAEINIVVGFKNTYTQDGGTMLTQSAYSDGTQSRTVRLEAFAEDGNLGHYWTGSGDSSQDKYGETVIYAFEKNELMKSDTWTFRISDLNLLSYH